MGVEFELKFRASREILDQMEEKAMGEKTTYAMETTYYDTPEGGLSARSFTLRRRMENDRSVCTFKFPAQGEGRGEIEVECDSIEAAIPELCKLSGLAELETLTGNGVVPVCGAKFQRTAFTFSWKGGVLELALDRGVLLGGGKQIPLFEAEVELKEGATDHARSYGLLLAAAYGLEQEPKSKFRRALDLAKEV